jgi:hypothetical protein
MRDRGFESLGKLLCAYNSDGHLEQLPLAGAVGVVRCYVSRMGTRAQAYRKWGFTRKDTIGHRYR